MAKKKRTSFRGRRPVRRLFLFLLFGGLLAAFVICAVYGVWASRFDLREVESIPERSAVYDMDGAYYSRLRGENRVVVPLDKVSPDFIDCLLAREDTRYYKHHGVDPIGIARAMVRNVLHGSIKEGGSTLTQQLARNSFDLGGQTLHRKLLEAFVALRIEQTFSKKEILEFYVNRIYFGSGYWGVETASQAYFGRPAAKLNLAESAMLVGLIRSPNRFSPFNNLKGAMRERDSVLKRMLDIGLIKKAEAEKARRTKIHVQKKSGPYPQENYAMDAVVRDLDVLLRDDQLREGGLRIYTTIDPRLQKAADHAVEKCLREIEQQPGYKHPKRSEYQGGDAASKPGVDYLQGAAVVIDNRTGGLRAVVGGREFSESRYNRALLSERQVGSTFKPFVYAAAFEKGLSPSSPIDDGPIRRGELRSVTGDWSPANSDGKYNGMMPAAEGLIESRNTMSVRVGDYAGIDAVQRVARAAGIEDVPGNAAIFLGAFEANLKDLTVAYSVFPNGGVRRQPYVIERIDDGAGNVLYRAAHVQAQALDPRTALIVSSVLQDVMERGTAASARRLGFKDPAGGKTGTTNDFHDAWFVGYTSSLTCGVWTGLDKPGTISSRAYGSALALPIWLRIMNAASDQRYPAKPLPRVATAVRVAKPAREEQGSSFPDRVLDSFRNFFRR